MKATVARLTSAADFGGLSPSSMSEVCAMTENQFEVDSTGKQYLEVSTTGGEAVRVTLVPAQEVKYLGREVLRLQVQEASGHLRMPGVDVPVERLAELLKVLERFRGIT